MDTFIRSKPTLGGRVEPRAMVSLAEAGQPRAVGHLASRTLSVRPDMTGEELNRIFEADPALNCVVMHRTNEDTSLGILPRLTFYRTMTGRFGYGYSLFSMRAVGELANWDPLVVRSSDDIESVTSMILRRPRDSRREDVVVRWPDGAMSTASAADVFEAIAGLYGHDALHDGLTALPNRVLFRDRVQLALDGLHRGGHAVAAIFIDLDDFKLINDTLGHAAGDEALRSFARRVAPLMRPGDTLARIGGDEFAILLQAMSRPEDAQIIAARLLQSLEAPFHVAGQDVHLGASLGIASATEPESSEVILRNADLAMYEAKRENRGGFRLFEQAMHREAMQRSQLEYELKRAIEGDELFLLYQPQVGADGTVAAVEALVRWNHPVHGELAPGSFIALAEHRGLIVDLDAWVFRRACREAAAWSTPVRVCVNVSHRTLDSGLLMQIIGDALIDGGMPPSRLEIEITERVAASGASRAPETLAELRQWGIRVAMDDFGTGYSALSRLSALPLDTVKIDGSFVALLGESPRAEVIVRTIIAMSGALGLSVVAEGVETTAQLEFLRSHGCQVAQGFLLGRPMPADQVNQILHAVVAAGRPLRIA